MSGTRGKVVAITGASGGIGEATALMLAERGAKVVLGARRAVRLEALAARIAAAGGEAATAATDVTQRADLENLVALAMQRFGRLDVLVSNAGIGPISPFDDLKVEDWEAMIDVNIKGVLYGIAAALPLFRRQGSGHFVHVISTAGIRIVPLQGVYAATKNAVRTLTEALRQEAGETLRVTSVSPGFVHTDFAEFDDRSQGQGRDRRAAGPNRHPARSHRPRHRLRDRRAGGCGRERDRRPADGAGVSTPLLDGNRTKSAPQWPGRSPRAPCGAGPHPGPLPNGRGSSRGAGAARLRIAEVGGSRRDAEHLVARA